MKYNEIMGGLKPRPKRRFIKKFLDKYPKANKEMVHEELKAVEKQFGVLKYHNKGFIFNLGNLTAHGYDFGNFISSFNIDATETIVTVGGKFSVPRGMGFGTIIHPHIYSDHTKLKLPIVKNNRATKICLGDIKYVYERMISFGMFFDAIDAVSTMLKSVELEAGLWHVFNFPTCSECDDNLTLEESELGGKCGKCS